MQTEKKQNKTEETFYMRRETLLILNTMNFYKTKLRFREQLLCERLTTELSEDIA